MKKSKIFLCLLLILLSISLALSADNETTNQSTNQTTTTSEQTSSTDKIQNAYDCLEEKAGDCSSLTTQEIALTIMATPDNIFDDCVTELESRESSDNWGNILDTALAIIALNHAGKDTESAEEWLAAQNKTPTDLIWYLQQDSNSEVECHIGYDAKDYIININEDKKIDKDAGSCLSRAQSNFWLQISNNCYEEPFNIECDKDFIANLIYKNKNSQTIYVLEGTSTAPAFGSIDLQIKSKCFGDNSCDYEATAWAALALLETGHNVEEFVPYIIAMSGSNEQYLPETFIFILTNYEDYASTLIAKQKLGNYWEAKSSAYDKYYDTGLALLTLSSSSSEQVSLAKDWTIFSQGSNGCWQNSVTDTAMMLWALEGRAGKIKHSGSSGSSVTYCTQANYFCITASECPSEKDVGDNYFCPSLSDTCCTSENLKTCAEYMGRTCATNEICTGNSRKSLDVDNCCTGSCKERAEANECEANFYTCMDTCSKSQEPISTYSCTQGQTCCKTKENSSSSKSSWWIWLLIILIIIILIAIGYIYREQLKLYWFRLKTKFKKDSGEDSKKSSGPPRSRIPPRPGFPPVRRPHPPTRPRQVPARSNQITPQKRSYDKRDASMSDTFRKLRDISK